MNSPLSILHPLNVTILDHKQDDHDYSFKVLTPEPTCCEACGSIGSLVKFGKDDQRYMDVPMHMKRVALWVVRQRYRCGSCGGTFRPKLRDMDDKRMMTKRLVEYVELAVMERTNLNVAQETGLDEKTVRQILDDYIQRHEKDHKPATPVWLGIDEVFLGKKYRATITNLQHNTVIDMLKDRYQPTIKNYILSLDRSKIEVVCTDMYDQYRRAVKQTLPHAFLVTDKFHVVAKANDAVESIRKTMRKGLPVAKRTTLKNDRLLLLMRERDLWPEARMVVETWTNQFPLLGNAYRLKESFYTIYDAKDAKEAKERYAAWRAGIPADQEAIWEFVTGFMSRWEKEVFNYFSLETRVTNAFTESANRLIKDKQRSARGLSFEVCRAKILFAQKHKIVKPKPKKQSPFEGMGRMTWGMMTDFDFEEEEIDYGVPASTVAALFERGDV